ncbi:MAG: GlxA family transcriptional regulator [Halieaceae bacterium]|jgi:transcriptional regulator GlxA family with amidase domain|nr:GlxA family transcriptional regulator [Halieaceae bacterium]
MEQTRTFNAPPKRVGFLLMDQFTLISLSSAIDPLRVANLLSGTALYSWHLIGSGERDQVSSDGIRVTLDYTLSDEVDFDLVIVVGGIDIEQSVQRSDLAWLRKQAQKGAQLGALCTGSYALASAGLLNGYQCSAHWDCLTLLTEQFPAIDFNSHLYTIDRDRLTCTGGTVPLHMMLAMIAKRHPQSLVDGVADMLVCERHRSDAEMQVIPMWSRKADMQPKLKEVLQLMEANLEEPITLQELADYVSLSRRQLERLFLKHLHSTPSRYYLKLRLDRARRLLKQTSRSIVEITSMCGFVSTTHFSRCYRKYMGVSPKSDRIQGETQIFKIFESELPSEEAELLN